MNLFEFVEFQKTGGAIAVESDFLGNGLGQREGFRVETQSFLVPTISVHLMGSLNLIVGIIIIIHTLNRSTIISSPAAVTHHH